MAVPRLDARVVGLLDGRHCGGAWSAMPVAWGVARLAWYWLELGSEEGFRADDIGLGDRTHLAHGGWPPKLKTGPHVARYVPDDGG